MNEKIEIFCCYAREDQPLLLKLRTHLAFLEREGSLSIWYDQNINPGAEWEEEINKHLNTAHLILLLISPDFLGSEYCTNREMKRAMKRHQLGEAHVIPILLRPCIWQEAPFAKLQVLPNNARAVTEWRSKDKALSAVAQGIEQVAKKLRTSLSITLSEQPQSTINAPSPNLKSEDKILQRDWGEAPDVPIFFGRTKELMLLEQWIVEDHCRLVALVGMKGIGKTRLSVKLGRGGIGKTDLSLKLARGIQEQFDYVIWRRLLNAPKMSELLADLVKFLSNQQEVILPDTSSQQISRLLHYLRTSRCLVILDNAEILLQGGKYVSQYVPGYEEYGQLFEQIANFPHQSCLLLTSREKMPEIARSESKAGSVRSLEIKGLNVVDGKKIFAEIGPFSGSKENWKQLNSLYNGNPLALELAARHIKEVFLGSISEFLKEGKPIFEDLRDLLDWHFNRLSYSHKEVMYWLAINREPQLVAELKKDISLPEAKEQIPSTLQLLQRLIPLEKSISGFTLQPVLIEYTTERFISQVAEEIRTEHIDLFNTHALLKTSAKDYVRESQVRLILMPIARRLLANIREEDLEQKLRRILYDLHQMPFSTGSYAAGNLLNFLIQLGFDTNGYDFSYLTIQQAFLQGRSLPKINFAHATFAMSVFTDTFGAVLSMAFSPNGKLLAAGTVQGDIRMWQMPSCTSYFICKGHVDWVWAVAFSPDGRLLISSGADQTVRLWEVDTGRCLQILQGHTSEVRSLALSSDGKFIATGSQDRTIRLWETSTGQCLKILQGHIDGAWVLAFSPDGRLLISSGADQTVRLWEVDTGIYLQTMQGYIDKVRSMNLSSDGKFIAIGSQDRTIRLWETSTGLCLKILQKGTDPVRLTTFSPDGRLLASINEDQTIRLWDLSSGNCLKTLQRRDDLVKPVVEAAMAFSPDGRMLASGSEDQTLRLWDVETGECLRTIQGYTNSVYTTVFSPNGRLLASGSEDQVVHLWEVGTGRYLHGLHGHLGQVWSIAFSPDNLLLASGSNDRTIRLWKTHSGQCLKTLQGHAHRVRSVAFSPDGQILASGSEDQTIQLWEVSTGKGFKTLQGHLSSVWSLTFNQDGALLASGSEDQTIRLWEVSTGECLKILEENTSRIYSIAFSPDSSLLASEGSNRTVRIWKVRSGQFYETLQRHTNRLRSIAFSPNGSLLASGSVDGTIRIWEVSSGECLRILEGETDIVWSISFSFDGKILVSGSNDGTVKLWNIETGMCLKVLRSRRPYEGMNITEARGLTITQKATLRTLGAIEDAE